MHIAAIYDALGEKDKAFATLDCACDSCSRSGKPNAVLFVAGAPLFTDARFATLEMKVAHSAISSALEVNP